MKYFIFYIFTIILIFANSPIWALEIPEPHKIHMVKGGNDIKIAVQEWGNLEGKPILFAHAWSQSHLSWLPQINSNLAEKYHIITFDYRGHGNSEKPLEKDQYNNADIWADDLNAIINILELNDVTLVGWSYGSIVIADYLNKYGTDKVKALNIVGGITALGVKRVENHFGEDAAASMQAFDPKLPTQAIAMLNIAKMMVPDNLDKETYGFLIATNMMTPAFVRKAMTERSVDYKELYQQLDIPVLFTHGTQDTGILPIAAIEAADFVQKSKLSLYEGANHGPHWFDAKRFNFELAKLVNAY